MALPATIRSFAPEPIVSALAISLLVNGFGVAGNAAFMHDEARDILSLGVVLVGAALALWIGLFWISSSDFGLWLSAKRVMERINAAYIASTVILLVGCVLCILCAHVSPTHAMLQLTGEFFAIYGLSTLATLLNNTRMLLKLHGEYERQRRPVTEIRSGTR